jgi:hypothetical protein
VAASQVCDQLDRLLTKASADEFGSGSLGEATVALARSYRDKCSVAESEGTAAAMLKFCDTLQSNVSSLAEYGNSQFIPQVGEVAAGASCNGLRAAAGRPTATIITTTTKPRPANKPISRSTALAANKCFETFYFLQRNAYNGTFDADDVPAAYAACKSARAEFVVDLGSDADFEDRLNSSAEEAQIMVRNVVLRIFLAEKKYTEALATGVCGASCLAELQTALTYSAELKQPLAFTGKLKRAPTVADFDGLRAHRGFDGAIV